MDTVSLLVLALQGVGSIALGLIGLTLKKISADNEENRKSITTLSDRVGNLALKMSEQYVTKEEWGTTRERVHDLTGTVAELRILTQQTHRRGTGD